MNIKLKIITTLLGVFFGCGMVAAQTPKTGQNFIVSKICVRQKAA